MLEDQTLTPGDVLNKAAAVKQAANERLAAIRADARLAPGYKTQLVDELKEATSKQLTGLRKGFGGSVTATRTRLEQDTMGGLKWSKQETQRALLEKAEQHARDPQAFRQATERATVAEDREMLNALTFAARNSRKLRALLPEAQHKAYTALDDFDATFGETANATRKMGYKITLSEWLPKP